jgi:phage shock protein C
MKPQSFSCERKKGYNANLYRNSRDRKIAGVCAGLADHFGISHWVMRIIFIGAFCMTGGAFFWAYIIGWVALASDRHRAKVNANEYDENTQQYRSKNMFRYRESPSVRIARAKERLEKTTRRIEDIECYVSSKHYTLNTEFKNL